MKLRSWQLFAAVGVASSLTVAACTTDDSIDDDDFGSGGNVQTGGTGGGATGGTGGSTTGGAGGEAPTGGTGGTTTTGGSGGEGGVPEVVICDDGPEANLGSTPGVCADEIDNTNECGACLIAECCTQANACLGTNPDNRCGSGPSELFCFQPCVREKFTVDFETLETAKELCAEECMAESCSTLGFATLEVIDCIDTNCSTQCWGE